MLCLRDKIAGRGPTCILTARVKQTRRPFGEHERLPLESRAHTVQHNARRE